MNPNAAPANTIVEHMTPDETKNQGNNKQSQDFTSANPNIQLRNVRQAKIDIRQADTNHRHSERGQLETSSPPPPKQEFSAKSNNTRGHSPRRQFQPSTAPQRRQRVLENQIRRRGGGQPMSRGKQETNAPSGISKLRGMIKEAAHIVKENYNAGVEAAMLESKSQRPRRAPEMRRERPATAGREANMDKPTSSHSRDSAKRAPGSSQSDREARFVLDKSSDTAREAVRTKLAEVRHALPKQAISRNPSDILCTICHRRGAVVYKETSSNPLCRDCLSLGFAAGQKPPPQVETPQIKVSDHESRIDQPAPLKITRRQKDDRCTLLPTQEELAAGTWGVKVGSSRTVRSAQKIGTQRSSPHCEASTTGTTDPLPPTLPPKTRALYESCAPPATLHSKHKDKSLPNPPVEIVETKPITPQRPQLHVDTALNNAEEYTPVSWRTVGTKPKPTTNTKPFHTATKAHRVTVASIWDDDVPDNGYLDTDVPSVPAIPSIPRLPFITPAATLSTKVGKKSAPLDNVMMPVPEAEAEQEQQDEKRFNRRRRYSPSVYSNREPSPKLEFGFQAVPEGRYENF